MMTDKCVKGEEGECIKCRYLDKTKYVNQNVKGVPNQRIGACIVENRHPPNCMWAGYTCDYPLSDGTWAFDPIPQENSKED